MTKAIVFMPGSRWQDVGGTDHQLATALAATLPVLWVDPPLPVHHGVRSAHRLTRASELSPVAPNITRLRSLSLPGFTRKNLAPLASRLLATAVRAAVGKLQLEPVATFVSSPIARFPAGLGGLNVLYVTDDWAAGAPLMGLDPALVDATLQANVHAADVTAAVSPDLAALIDQRLKPGQAATEVVANGCEVQAPSAAPREATAALVGQLNERLDMDILAALNRAGVPLLVIGPRTDRDPQTGRDLDEFLAAPNVTWLGRLPFAPTQDHLATVRVGLTPYGDTAFNRASFPLKTLDYLAAGLHVVATDLPAVRWLDTDLVAVGRGTEDYVQRVQAALASETSRAAEDARRTFAGHHSWQARARQFLDVIEGRVDHVEVRS
ncbi:Putative teichuronic acid biosynthesis glycosyltransferase TuaH [Arthrobacter ulcerisalmonis]|uniref:Teichuronic acid biosynthesis glycosyltransferase TuaH n=1 Tax=Arthrobacter ulcerisalmonis TaxID=2483813 RepID=A0A3P5X0E3_9MICC|nr:glycosyltransferase [Arthrobacter ulcerisalmonis]VDC21339.1 Putative teichuronic acid biosynthesis glycosyltransferase TuaH [Arthrobacter ulcerisalmonis]